MTIRTLTLGCKNKYFKITHIKNFTMLSFRGAVVLIVLLGVFSRLGKSLKETNQSAVFSVILNSPDFHNYFCYILKAK